MTSIDGYRKARDEFPIVSSVLQFCSLERTHYDAAMDRIDTLTAENAELKAANGSEHPVEGMEWCLTHDRLHTGVTWTDERFVDRADYAKWCNPSCRVVPVFFHKEQQ